MELLNAKEAAKIKGVSRAALYLAIREKKLKYYDVGGVKKISRDDLEEYFNNKYARAKSRVDDELIFDERKGLLSINQAAEFVGVCEQKIYYAVRKGILPAHRVRCSYVICLNHLLKYQRLYLNKDSPKALEATG